MNRLLIAKVWLLAESLALAQLGIPADGRADPPRGVQVLAPQLDLLPGGQLLEINALSPEVYVDEVGGDLRAQIERIDEFLSNRKFAEAVDMLMRLTEEGSDKLVLSREQQGSFATYITLRRYVQQKISSLEEDASEARRIYRERVDPLAAQQLARGLRQRDDRLLRQIVNESFCSSSADEALFVLGELALERGEFDRARRYWQTIHGELSWSEHARKLPFDERLRRGESRVALARDMVTRPTASSAYVDSPLPISDVWARLCLVSVLEANLRRARAEIELLEQVWPDARGQFAGREVNYVQWLRRLITDSRFGDDPSQRSSWNTFAGNNRRNRNLRIPPIDIALRPSWTTPLRSRPSGEQQLAGSYDLPRERAGESFERPCNNFPVVARKLIFIHDEGRIRSLDARTGKPVWSGRDDGVFFTTDGTGASGKPGPISPRSPATPRLGQPRYTLSTHDGTLLAVLPGSDAPNTAIVGFDLRAEGAVRFGPIELEDPKWSFLGAPVCDASRCWVGRRLRGDMAQDFIASYDLHTGRQLWQTRIASAETIGQGTIEELTNQLLTLHEDTVYCTTGLGVIAALSSDDGSLRWLTKYPRSGPRRNNLLNEPWYAQRDLTPCLYYRGLVIAAPADCEYMFALDAHTGAMIWHTNVAADATQLLGVGEGEHLIVSGRRLWWLDIFTGRPSPTVETNPFPPGAFASLRGHGRGVLAAGNVYWPTQTEAGSQIQVLDQRTGRTRRQPIDLTAAGANAGNLIIAAGHLFIAAHDQLYAFRLEHGRASQPTSNAKLSSLGPLSRASPDRTMIPSH